MKHAAILRRALDGERERVGPEQAEIIEEFLEHGEIGLARDQLLNALSDLELEPLDGTLALLAEEAKLAL